MIESAITRLEYLCNIAAPFLTAIGEPSFSLKTSPENWSKKEIIGHLIDSAINNHQRFVRAQFEQVPTIVYDQNKWNKFNYYQQMDGQQIISFWVIYNRQLVQLFKCISIENLALECKTGTETPLTIGFLFNDYVQHQEHHLRQVIVY